VAVLVLALLFDLAAHQDVATVGTTVLAAAAMLALLATGRIRTRQALVLGLAAVVVAVFLSLRTSPWLVVADSVAVLALVAATASYAAGGWPGALTATAIVSRAGRLLVSCALAPAYALACAAALLPARDAERRRRLVAVARGVGIALPVVVVLALLLASADAVFASLFALTDDLGSVAGHVALVGLGVMVASALFVEASAPEVPDGEPLGSLVGPTEAAVVLGSVAALYGAFAVVQVVTLRGGATHVMETAGLTYADYARQGFFQLLAVAVLTVAVVAGVRAWTRPGTRRQRIVLAAIAEVVLALALVIVFVAVRRLDLYEDAFGSTMLRLASTWSAWWLGVVLVIIGIATAGVGGRRRWLAGAVVASALVALVAWNVVNPEALVVERNLGAGRVDEREVDADYLWRLSDDAIPALAASLPDLEPSLRPAVVERICFVRVSSSWSTTDRVSTRYDDPVVRSRHVTVLAPGPGAPDGPDAPGGLAANRSTRLAADVRADVCP
jgi:hypothetical protein